MKAKMKNRSHRRHIDQINYVRLDMDTSMLNIKIVLV